MNEQAIEVRVGDVYTRGGLRATVESFEPSGLDAVMLWHDPKNARAAWRNTWPGAAATLSAKGGHLGIAGVLSFCAATSLC